MSMSPRFSKNKNSKPVRDSQNSIISTCITVKAFNLVTGDMIQAKGRLGSDEPSIVARLQTADGLTGYGSWVTSGRPSPEVVVLVLALH